MKKRRSPAFTIVELLIVVVIIAILAAITIVAYNGIQNRARASAASSALSQAVKKLELYKVDNSAYPTSTNLASAGITNANDTTYQYTSDGTTYCLTATNVSISYYLNSTTTPSPAAGGCPGHGVGGNSAITNLATNPSVETATPPWQPGNVLSQIARSNTGLYGAYALRQTITTSGQAYIYNTAGTGGVSVSAGQVINASLSVKNISGGSRPFFVALVWRDGAGNGVGTQANGTTTDVAVGSTSRLTVTGTAPSGASTVQVQARTNSAVQNDVYDWDGLMLTEGSTVYNYADGSSQNWVWNGTANASSSTGPAL